MRDLKNKLTSGKNTKNTQGRKGKSFGYQVLGFGAGGAGFTGICASGGTITEDGDYKIHTFNGAGTFTVNALSDDPAFDAVDYAVVGGGGGGIHGGGGAGGFRQSSGVLTGGYAVSPLGACVASLPVSVTGYPIAVGAGGSNNAGTVGCIGSPSSFQAIDSSGGGGGGGRNANGGSGASGGGGGDFGNTSGGSGSAGQGNPGGNGGGPSEAGASGGGATASGGPAASFSGGGAGATTAISGSSVIYSFGGNGDCGAEPPAGPNNPNPGSGFGGQDQRTADGGSVIIRYRFK